MDINLDISFTNESIKKLTADFSMIENKYKVGEVRAMNRTANEMRTEAKREILKTYTIKSNKLLHAFRIFPEKNHVILRASGAVYSAIDFKYKQKSHMARKKTPVKTKTGFAMVKQRIWEIVLETKHGQKVTMKDAFMRPISKSVNGSVEKKHIFVRHPGEDAHIVLGPSVPAMLNSKNVLPHVIEYGQERLQKNMLQQLNFIKNYGGNI